jgi:hypothetical protein
LALLAASWGFAERIQILAFFFITALIYWRELYLLKKISYRSYLGGVLAGIILWANIHMTFVFGVFLLGLYLLDDLIDFFKRRNAQCLKKSGAAFILSFIATGANPYGYYYTLTTLTYYFQPQVQKIDAQISGSILEYQPLFSPVFSQEPFVTYGLVWIAFSLLGILLGWKKNKASFYLVWALFTYWSFGYIRFLWLQVFLSVAGIGAAWQGGWDFIRSRIAGRMKVPSSTAVLFCLIPAVFAGTFLYQRSGQNLWQRIGLGWRPGLNSEKGAEFLAFHRGAGRVFNDFDIGGFLAWKEIPVFVDGRIAPYFNTPVIQDHFKISSGNLSLLDKYGVDWIVLPYARTSLTQEFDRFNQTLLDSRNWALVYWDDAYMIYVRRTAAHDSVVQKYEYKYVNPAVPDLELPAELFLSELKRKTAESSELSLPYVLASNYYFAHNDIAEALAQLTVALRKDPRNGTLYNNLGNILLRQGQVEQAIHAYRQAVKYDVNLGLAYCNWGYLMEAKGEAKQAVKLYTIATKVTPGDAWPYNRLGIIEAKRGNRLKAMEYWRKGAAIDPQSEAAANLRQTTGGR